MSQRCLAGFGDDLLALMPLLQDTTWRNAQVNPHQTDPMAQYDLPHHSVARRLVIEKRHRHPSCIHYIGIDLLRPSIIELKHEISC